MQSDCLEEALSILNELGLTIVQARVYMALLKSDSSTVKIISDLSKVARTDLYRVISELEKEGLVERILSHPIQFRAIPLSECIPALLHSKNEQSRKLQKRTAKMLSNFKRTSIFAENLQPRFVFVPSKRVGEKIAKAIDNSKVSIDMLLTWNRISNGTLHFFDKLKAAWARGVKCRMVVEKPGRNVMPSRVLASYLKSQLCEVRFTSVTPETVVGIYDKKEVFVIENPTAPINESPCLWSNSPSLLSLSNHCFDSRWQKAIKGKIART